MIKILHKLTIFVLIGLVVMIFQNHWGIGFKDRLLLDSKKLKEDRGYSARYKLPEEHRRLMSHQKLKLYEDGERIGFPVRANREVREKGRGRYRVLDKYLRFSASDLSNPITNEKQYEISLPKPVRREVLYGTSALLAGLLGYLSWFSKQKGIPLWLPSFSDRWDLVIICIIALLMRLWVLWAPAYDNGGLVVKGMPYSDALGWNEMAIGLAEGKGITGRFDGHRPLYAYYLGGVYSLFGNSLIIGKLFNVLTGALASGFLYLLGRATGSRVIGLALGILGGISSGYLSMIHVTATEAFGFLLTLMSIYLLWKSITTNKPALYLIAGLFFGFANLTKTFTLLAFPLYVLAILLFSIQGNWKYFLTSTTQRVLLFILGVFLVLTPWLVRQKVTHDAFTISTNSADVLYGATTPEGKWGTAQFEEAVAAGIDQTNKARHAFLKKRLVETVSENPQIYLEERWGNFKEAWLWFKLKKEYFPLVLSLCVLFFVIDSSRKGKWLWRLILTIGLIFVFLESEYIKNVLLPASFLITVVLGNRSSKILSLILASTYLGGLIMSSLIGNVSYSRSMNFTNWIVWLIHLQAIYLLFYKIFNPIKSNQPVSKSNGIFEGFSVGWFLATIPLFIITALVKQFFYHSKPEHIISRTQYEEIRNWASINIPELAEKNLPESKKYYATLASSKHYQIEINKNEEIDHDAPIFQLANKNRKVTLLRQGVETSRPNSIQGAWMNSPSKLPTTPYLAVGTITKKQPGLFGDDNQIVNILAIAPYDINTRTIDLSSMKIIK